MNMLLQLDSINKTYQANGQAVSAVQQVSLDIDAGDFCALQGSSGCGKSTLLMAAGGLLQPDSGRVVIDGQDLYRIAPNERALFRGRNIGFVFQQFHLIPYLNVLQNVLSAGMGTDRRGGDSLRDRAGQLVDRFGLAGRQHHRPSQLSTGERQRTALARALLNQPRILLADEPTGNLDDVNSDKVLEYLSQFASEGGAVLLVTHEERAASRAQRHLWMSDGRLVAEPNSG